MADLPLSTEGRRKLEEALAFRDMNLTEAGELVGVTRFTFARWLKGGRVQPKNRHALKEQFGLADSDFDADAKVSGHDDELIEKIDQALAVAESRQQAILRELKLLRAGLTSAGIEIPRDVVREGAR